MSIISSLSASQISALSTSTIASLTTTDIAALSSTQVAALSSSQVNALTTDDIAAFTGPQISAVSLNALIGISSAQIVALTTRCLMITGFIQSGFAANLVFGGALRGAGDTLTVMLLNLASVVTLRFTGVLYVGYHHLGLAAVWVCLSSELFIRGSLVTARFFQGGWKRVIV